MNFPQYIKQRRAWVDRTLRSVVPKASRKPARLHHAIRYSLFAGGKRLRPILVLAAMESVVNRSAKGAAAVRGALPVAAAVELIHTYSLVHDDLPAMDDDDWRRGRPTSHKVFGEAAAILVGDAMLTAAFKLVGSSGCRARFKADTLLKVVYELGEAAGSTGMVGGQMMDIQSAKDPVTEETVRTIHSHKTGALIRASVRVGGLLGGASAGKLAALSAYGEKIGLAFQITDDILDVEGDPDLMGKRARKDEVGQKITYPGVVGVGRSRAQSQRLARGAVSALARFDERADPLRELAQYLVGRSQ